MQPKQYLQKFAAAVTKRCGICQATVEQVLPAVFDEIRQQLIESENPCVPIDSFGTFVVTDVPAREYYNTYKGVNKWVQLPATKRLKFRPAYNVRKELEAGEYDPTRKSFSHHPKDPTIRKRKQLSYQPNRGVHIGKTRKKKED